jgi:hypothetical protein
MPEKKELLGLKMLLRRRNTTSLMKFHPLTLHTSPDLKDRLGDQRGGSEWEPIKILLKNLAYAPKSLPKNLAYTCQDHVVTTDLLTLGTS